jgi:UbiD family decarboxylase
MLAGSADIPYGMDELAVAGGIAGAPVELVRCKTIPLEVPAYAECIIEGIISTETVEPRLPFGEYPGYINVDYNVRPVMQVTAVTHRRDAMFTPVLVGFPPSDTNAVWGFCQSAMMYEHLRYGCPFPVDEVYCPQRAAATTFASCAPTKERRRTSGKSCKPRRQCMRAESGLSRSIPISMFATPICSSGR